MNSQPTRLKRDRIASANSFAERLRPQLSTGAVLRFEEPLARRTTFRVGGAADVFLEPACIVDLAAVLRACLTDSMPFLVMGRGSNLLVRDGGFPGVVICLVHPSFTYIRPEDGGLRCGSGAKLKDVAYQARKMSLSGLEFLEGIPGTIGGALRMNAGAMGAQMFDRVKTVQYMTPEGVVNEARGQALGARYRSCDFFAENIALGALLDGDPAAREDIETRMSEYSRKRWASQPAAPSAGCMFKNPPDMPAGKLIDELGLKGFSVGGAAVSTEHGNFLVNTGGATARDIIGLIDVIRQKVREKRGIELQVEVKIVGTD